MAWTVLIISGMFETVWALALSKSEGFTRWLPSLIFLVAVVISMGGLAYAMRSLPVGTAYAIWVGIGASLTVIIGMATGVEDISAVKIALIMGLVGCVVGLKYPSHETKSVAFACPTIVNMLNNAFKIYSMPKSGLKICKNICPKNVMLLTVSCAHHSVITRDCLVQLEGMQ